MDTHLPGVPEPARERLPDAPSATPVGSLTERLGGRTIVLVGMPGAGKTTVGKRLASRLDLPFRDADVEIEAAAGMPITDIFSIYGEPSFRDGERRVIARLLAEGPLVLATGGGAFMSSETRERVAEAGISVFLKVDHETLMRRVRRKATRPLLRTPDPDATMLELLRVRQPIYSLADLTVESRDWSHERVAGEVARVVDAWLRDRAP